MCYSKEMNSIPNPTVPMIPGFEINKLGSDKKVTYLHRIETHFHRNPQNFFLPIYKSDHFTLLLKRRKFMFSFIKRILAYLNV